MLGGVLAILLVVGISGTASGAKSAKLSELPGVDLRSCESDLFEYGGVLVAKLGVDLNVLEDLRKLFEDDLGVLESVSLPMLLIDEDDMDARLSGSLERDLVAVAFLLVGAGDL